MNAYGKKSVTSWQRRTLLDVVTALFILLLPFIPFLHLLFSEESSRLGLFGMSYEHGFPDNQVFAWFCLLYLSSLIFTLLMYFFSFGLWRIILLLPIGYYISYPVWTFANEQPDLISFILSDFGLVVLLPAVLAILISDRYIKTKLRDRNIQLTFETGCREVFYNWNSRYSKGVRKTLSLKPQLSLREYIHRVYFYAVLLEEQQSQFPREQGPARRVNSRWGNLWISALLVLLSLLLLAHQWIPKNQQQIEFLGIEIDSFGFIDLTTFIFYASHKLVLFLLGLLWLATSPYWWRWALLSPILFYLYQFWESLRPVRNLESSGNLKLLPLVFIIILGIALLAVLIRRISQNREYHDFLKSELERSLKELSREQARNYLLQIKVHKPETL